MWTTPIVKLYLDLFMVAQKKYEKDQDAWIKNRARTYNLVLQHFLPDFEADLKNQSAWTVSQYEQNLFNLLHIIREITHNMRESKQGVIAIVECAVEMNTTAQKSSETEDYLNIFEARRNTVKAHDERTVYHEGMFKKAPGIR